MSRDVVPEKTLKSDVERKLKRESAEAEKLRRGRVDPEGLPLRGETEERLSPTCLVWPERCLEIAVVGLLWLVSWFDIFIGSCQLSSLLLVGRRVH